MNKQSNIYQNNECARKRKPTKLMYDPRICSRVCTIFVAAFLPMLSDRKRVHISKMKADQSTHFPLRQKGEEGGIKREGGNEGRKEPGRRKERRNEAKQLKERMKERKKKRKAESE